MKLITRRIKSEFLIEKTYGYFFLFLLLTCLAIPYFLITKFNILPLYCILGAAIPYIHFFILFPVLTDTQSPKKLHKGSLEQYINSLNITGKSILDKCREIDNKKGQERYYEENKHETLGAYLSILLLIPFLISMMVFMLSEVHYYQYLVLCVIHGGLILLNYYVFNSENINTLKVNKDQLLGIASVNGLSDNELSDLKKSVASKIKKNEYIERKELVDICNNVLIARNKREELEILN